MTSLPPLPQNEERRKRMTSPPFNIPIGFRPIRGKEWISLDQWETRPSSEGREESLLPTLSLGTFLSVKNTSVVREEVRESEGNISERGDREREGKEKERKSAASEKRRSWLPKTDFSWFRMLQAKASGEKDALTALWCASCLANISSGKYDL